MPKISKYSQMLQNKITKETIVEMLSWHPRRFKLSQWEAIRPGTATSDPSLFLPFIQTLKNAFLMSGINQHTLWPNKNDPNRCFTYLNSKKDPDAVNKAKKWLEVIQPYVVIRDCLCLSFALDYDKEDNDPNNPQTNVGALRSKAKTYGGAIPELDNFQAADELAKLCVEFLKNMPCYSIIDCIVAMPSSNPDAKYSLPNYIAEKISKETNIPNLSSLVKTISLREQMKNCSIQDKLSNIEGTVEVADKFPGKNVLLIDDIYQSGISMNYVAMQLQAAGVDRILGLCCEKTCRNDDNIQIK